VFTVKVISTFQAYILTHELKF